jgi:hypothetical protein
MHLLNDVSRLTAVLCISMKALSRKPLVYFLSIAIVFSATSMKGADGDVRMLFDFEDDAGMKAIASASENVKFDAAPDVGVTSGQRCCRMTFQKNSDWSQVQFTGGSKEGWQNYDYFAMDIVSEEKANVILEFQDELTNSYATRCSLSGSVVPGKQTVLIRINQPKRNGKEGLDWDQIQPQDKINLAALKVCKFMVAAPKDHDIVWHVDQIRLLKENALGLSIDLKLPTDTIAFCFGKAKKIPGFITVGAPQSDGDNGFVQKGDLKDCGMRWPDPLSGTGVYSPSGKQFTFESKVPDGEYRVWLAASPVIKTEINNPHFLLKVNGTTIVDDSPSLQELYSERYIYRFMNTPYSQRENALWLDFIDKMYPTHDLKIKVVGGKLTLELCNYQLSSIIVVPEKHSADFQALRASIKAERIRIFNAQRPVFNPTPLARQDGDGAFVCFIPDEMTAVTPVTGVTASERRRNSYDLAAAAPQNVFFRIAISAYEDLGKCSVSLSDLSGPKKIPASTVSWYFQDYRLRGVDLQESALIPTTEVSLEKGVTRCFWAWLKLPADTPAGVYSGKVTVLAAGKSKTFPLGLTVYPFKLDDALPLALGMWYTPRETPDPSLQKKVIAEHFAFMREIGFTAVQLPNPNGNGDVDGRLFQLAKEAGFGRNPQQMIQICALEMARAIGRRDLGLSGKIDQQPGCELELPEFKARFIASAKRLAVFIKEIGLPLAVQSADEPRETPNPWNRNLADTNRYGDYLKEVGIQNTYVTPMSDAQSGKDYLSLVDHHDIIATHAGKPSERLMKETPAKGKSLWLYNIGMDRLSWGFYNWRVGSAGRYEWHFCWNSGAAENGYLNDEWYNPFTPYVGYTSYAPYPKYKGAILFTSAFLTCAEGITDSAYLSTLKGRIESANGTPAAAKAQEFLDGIRNEIPFLPEVNGIATEADGALVGKGLKTPAAAKCEGWRRRIAELLLAQK